LCLGCWGFSGSLTGYNTQGIALQSIIRETYRAIPTPD
jgi:hypothetical protein